MQTTSPSKLQICRSRENVTAEHAHMPHHFPIHCTKPLPPQFDKILAAEHTACSPPQQTSQPPREAGTPTQMPAYIMLCMVQSYPKYHL
jgi:hypothetical protein